jgi:hypothetical protein
MQDDFNEHVKVKKALTTNKVPSTWIDEFRYACFVYPRLERPGRAKDLRDQREIPDCRRTLPWHYSLLAR